MKGKSIKRGWERGKHTHRVFVESINFSIESSMSKARESHCEKCKARAAEEKMKKLTREKMFSKCPYTTKFVFSSSRYSIKIMCARRETSSGEKLRENRRGWWDGSRLQMILLFSISPNTARSSLCSHSFPSRRDLVNIIRIQKEILW